MSDFQIIDKDELTNVDRSADYILVYDFNAAKLVRSNVNSLLDLLSHPVGIDDAQTLTNKTITAPAISSPVLSGTITGTYTLGGTPTFPSSVVTLTGSQTLTNKVLTSPTINTANIVNPTLAVDTISEHTADNGVTIDGLNIKDGALTTANSVTNAALAAESVGNSKLITTAGDLGGVWKEVTPTLTNMVIGTGGSAKNVQRYTKIGKTVHVRGEIIFGTSGSSVSGIPIINLPVTAATIFVSAAEPVGIAKVLDASPAGAYTCVMDLPDVTTVRLVAVKTDATYLTNAAANITVPITWTAGDAIMYQLTYEAA